MSNQRKTAIVICPGRGSYNKSELGYYHQHHADKPDLLQAIDQYRRQQQQIPVADLDQAEQYDRGQFNRGDNASSLIYACAYADFLSIDRERFDIVAITGNSMGWYIALACANALGQHNALHLINHMGGLMHSQQTGGQIIYPFVDENWQKIPGRYEALIKLREMIHAREGCKLYTSIELGGMLVFAGNQSALKLLQSQLEPISIYPMRLSGHGAFHSPIMQAICDQARTSLGANLFSQIDTPLIDGRGNNWQPWSTDPAELWDYTLGEQITNTYNFTRAIQNSIREFAPDHLIILGPGNSLGAVTAQALIDINWHDLSSKQDFSDRQEHEPFILSMGLETQRNMCLRP